MAVVAGNLVLEVQEPQPPNVAMREAARFAHFIRQADASRLMPWENHDQFDHDLVVFWRGYQEHGPEEFQQVFVKCARIRAGLYAKLFRRWAQKRDAYLASLAAKRVSPDVEWRRRQAWERRNPRPQNVGRNANEMAYAVQFCEECGEPRFPHAIVQPGAARGVNITICTACLRANYTSCERCHRYIRNGTEHYHPPEPRVGSACRAPRERFRMPNALLEAGYQPSDRIVRVVTQSGGLVPASAIAAVLEIVKREGAMPAYWTTGDLKSIIGDLAWETTAGKFPKRVVNALYRHRMVKLSSAVVSEIGNIARQAMSEGSTHFVEFTRQLNDRPENFLNGGSCWWGSRANPENRNRCLLKENAGMAMRIFADDHVKKGGGYNSDSRASISNLLGRAWVVPLQARKRTRYDSAETLFNAGEHDPMKADAFLLFNAYGKGTFAGSPGQQMSAILAATLGVEHVRSISSFHQTGMYINGGSSYVISRQPLDGALEVHMVVGQADIKCSCVTHKPEPEIVYEYDDTGWTPLLIGEATPAPTTTTKRPGEEEEPEDDDTGSGGGNVAVARGGIAAERVFDDDDAEPEDDGDLDALQFPRRRAHIDANNF